MDVALVAVIGSSVVGVAGVASGVFTAASDRRHQRYLASEARRQDRLQSTYLRLLEYVRLTNVHLEGRWAPEGHGWWPSPGAAPTGSEYEVVAAAVDAYGSPQVRSARAAWWIAAREALDHSVELTQLTASGATGSEQWDVALETYLETFFGPVDEATNRLIELINGELRIAAE